MVSMTVAIADRTRRHTAAKRAGVTLTKKANGDATLHVLFLLAFVNFATLATFGQFGDQRVCANAMRIMLGIMLTLDSGHFTIADILFAPASDRFVCIATMLARGCGHFITIGIMGIMLTRVSGHHQIIIFVVFVIVIIKCFKVIEIAECRTGDRVHLVHGHKLGRNEAETRRGRTGGGLQRSVRPIEIDLQ